MEANQIHDDHKEEIDDDDDDSKSSLLLSILNVRNQLMKKKVKWLIHDTDLSSCLVDVFDGTTGEEEDLTCLTKQFDPFKQVDGPKIPSVE